MPTLEQIILRASQAILLFILVGCLIAILQGKTHQLLYAAISLIMLLTISKEENHEL